MTQEQELTWLPKTLLETGLGAHVPTVDDLAQEGDPTKKVQGRIKGWKFRLFDLHSDNGQRAYEKLRMKLLKLTLTHRVKIVRDGPQLIGTQGGGQRLYYTIEWIELDWRVFDHKAVPDLAPSITPET